METKGNCQQLIWKKKWFERTRKERLIWRPKGWAFFYLCCKDIMNTPSSAPCQAQTLVANTYSGWAIGRGKKWAWVQPHEMERTLRKDGWGKYLEEDSPWKIKEEGCQTGGLCWWYFGWDFCQIQRKLVWLKTHNGMWTMWRQRTLKGGQMRMQQTMHFLLNSS